MGAGPEKGYEIGVFSYLNYRRIPFFIPRRYCLGNCLSPDLKSHRKSDLTRNLKRFPKSFFHGPNIFILLISPPQNRPFPQNLSKIVHLRINNRAPSLWDSIDHRIHWEPPAVFFSIKSDVLRIDGPSTCTDYPIFIQTVGYAYNLIVIISFNPRLLTRGQLFINSWQHRFESGHNSQGDIR